MIVQLVLDRPFVFEFVDRTRSSRPPREALPPPSEPAPLLARLMGLPPFETETHLPDKDIRQLLAFWGD